MAYIKGEEVYYNRPTKLSLTSKYIINPKYIIVLANYQQSIDKATYRHYIS